MSSIMDTASNPRMSFTVQPEKQVTCASATLSGALFTSRPVISARAVKTRKNIHYNSCPMRS